MANMVMMVGRLSKDVEVKEGSTMVAKYGIAVDRKFKRDGDPDADFFSCTCFGKTAEFAQKYLSKGKKILIIGELRNNNYTNKDGKVVYRDEIVVSQHEFVESKSAESTEKKEQNDFMPVSDDVELPFT